MGSFEWMEVETLSGEIAALETRLAAAKSRHNYGLAKVLGEEIAAAQQRRARYLLNITTSLAGSLDPAADPTTTEDEEPGQPDVLPREDREKIAEPGQQSAEFAGHSMAEAPEELAEPDQPSAELADDSAQDVPEELADPDQPSAQSADPSTQEGPEGPADPDQPGTQLVDHITTSRVASPDADTIQGVAAVWDQLTPTDMERAKQQLDTRRAEMLARHAEEIKTLESDQSEIDTLAQAIDAFVRKFNSPSAAGSVVRLDEERDIRQQSHS